MADTASTLKGMKDILPPEVSRWHFVEEKARAVLDAFGYREIRTPILEPTALFNRSVGETTEVVEKQMYTFDDKDGSSVTMRPEGTAPVVRSFIAETRWLKDPVTRWYYLGAMFRHEAPQSGRLRQFHQVGAEVFGIPTPSIDAEMIAMLATMLGEFGVPAEATEVWINTLGEPEERAAYREALRAFLLARKDKLDDDARRRIDGNPLRVLDSKNPDVQAVCKDAPLLIDTLGEGSRARFATVRTLLTGLGVRAELDPRLVRGLDYYTSTIFEIKVDAGDLGAQNTVCGGGRYDRLVESLGGPATPALGFGMGLERVLLALDQPAESFEAPLNLFFVPLEDAALSFVLPIAHRLARAGLRCEVEHRMGSIKSQLRRADKLRARFAVIVGGNELVSGKLVLKDLAKKTQTEIGADGLEAAVRAALD